MVKTIRAQTPNQEQVAYGRRLRHAIGLGEDDPYELQRLAELVEVTGLSRQAVTLACKGMRTFGARANSKAAHLLGVDSDWLATGEGVPQPASVWPFSRLRPSDLNAVPSILVDAVEKMLLAAIEHPLGKAA